MASLTKVLVSRNDLGSGEAALLRKVVEGRAGFELKL